MSKIKAILFDMDGVLIDAKEWHYEALNKALAIFGMTINRYEHLTTYDGLPTKKKLEILSLEYGLPRELHTFINEIKQEYTFQIGYSCCKPTFNHRYTLSQLSSMGLRMAVCSNSIRKSMEIFLEKAALANFFEFYLSNEDVRYPKPHPEIYSTAINKLRLLPEECLIVEDNEKGIESARASGAHLMIVKDISEVNLDNITSRLEEIGT